MLRVHVPYSQAARINNNLSQKRSRRSKRMNHHHHLFRRIEWTLLTLKHCGSKLFETNILHRYRHLVPQYSSLLQTPRVNTNLLKKRLRSGKRMNHLFVDSDWISNFVMYIEFVTCLHENLLHGRMVRKINPRKY
jgi:hypothetical protein